MGGSAEHGRRKNIHHAALLFFEVRDSCPRHSESAADDLLESGLHLRPIDILDAA